jgi:hypothetical protein
MFTDISSVPTWSNQTTSPHSRGLFGVAASARALQFSLIMAWFFLEKLADIIDRC